MSAYKQDPLADLDYQVGKLGLQADDIVVLHTTLMLDKDLVKQLRERVEEEIGQRVRDVGAKIVVITGGLCLAVIRKEEN